MPPGWLLSACACACLAGCTEDEVQLAMTDSFGDEDPKADEVPATAVTLSVSRGGHVIPCSRAVDVDGCVAVDDGFLALPDLPIVASGPYLAPTGLTGGPCMTVEYCFPHASLPDGVDAIDTYLELAAGSADQRIPVHVIRPND